MIIIYVYHINAVSRIYDEDLLLIVYKYHIWASYVCIIWMSFLVLVIFYSSYMSIICVYHMCVSYMCIIWTESAVLVIFLPTWYEHHMNVMFRTCEHLWFIYECHIWGSYICKNIFLIKWSVYFGAYVLSRDLQLY